MNSQYPLPLALPPVFSEDNFFVAGCNREAWQWIMAWPQWPAHALLIYGPAGSGKSHLGQLWAARAGATVYNEASTAATMQNSALIENIEQLTDERALLHWFNYSRENGHFLLLTASLPPQQLPFTLPDLTSRLLAIPAINIGQPDDELLAAAMRKQFADRQMKVDDEVVAYILPRIERSMGEVKQLVEWLDSCALAERKSLTIPFVRRLMEIPSKNSLS